MQPTQHHPTRLERFQDKLAKSRDWSISLAIHAVLVGALSTYVLVKATNEDDTAFQSCVFDSSTIGPISTPHPEWNDRPDIKFNEPKLSEAATPKMEHVPSSSTDAQIPGVTTKALNGPIICLLPVGPKTDFVLKPSASNVPKEMLRRTMKDGNNQIIMNGNTGKGTGSTPETENAALRGLNWLREHQNEDGSWGLRNKGAMTGLALLAFLGHGETGDSKYYGLNVNRAIDWVLKEGTTYQGRLSMTKGDWGPGNAGVYEHGILTYALGEYYNLTKDERVAELYQQAIAYIIQGQGPDGGWMYNYDKTQSDTSVSGWQVQALKAAHLTKLNIPGIDAALDRAMKNFDRVQGPNGGYGYRTPGDRYSLSGVGLACELFWNGKRDSDMRRGVKFILDQTKAEPVQYEHSKADLYAWYYHTQAMLMFGGTAWVDWEAQFRPMALKSQADDGSWPVMKAVAHGNLQTDSTVTGGVYRTSLSVLMLESYYRYLFLNQAQTTNPTGTLALR